MDRMQKKAIRWAQKFCLGRLRAKNMSREMNSTIAAMAIRPAILLLGIAPYLRCLASDSMYLFTLSSVIAPALP